MALVGESDPRWIVTERDDGKNVNNWHWSEKDVTPKAKEIFTSLIETTKEKNIDIISVGNISIQATLFNRKKKIGVFYELSTDIKWKCKCGNQMVEGGATLVEIGEEVTDDLDIRVTIKKPDLDRETVKMMKREVKQYIIFVVQSFQWYILQEFEIPTTAAKPVQKESKIKPSVRNSGMIIETKKKVTLKASKKVTNVPKKDISPEASVPVPTKGNGNSVVWAILSASTVCAIAGVGYFYMKRN